MAVACGSANPKVLGVGGLGSRSGFRFWGKLALLCAPKGRFHRSKTYMRVLQELDANHSSDSLRPLVKPSRALQTFMLSPNGWRCGPTDSKASC